MIDYSRGERQRVGSVHSREVQAFLAGYQNDPDLSRGILEGIGYVEGVLKDCPASVLSELRTIARETDFVHEQRLSEKTIKRIRETTDKIDPDRLSLFTDYVLLYGVANAHRLLEERDPNQPKD